MLVKEIVFNKNLTYMLHKNECGDYYISVLYLGKENFLCTLEEGIEEERAIEIFDEGYKVCIETLAGRRPFF